MGRKTRSGEGQGPSTNGIQGVNVCVQESLKESMLGLVGDLEKTPFSILNDCTFSNIFKDTKMQNFEW